MEYLPPKFQQLVMDMLFGRFPHLAEDIFGLLNGGTLFCCRQINQTWNKNLDNYRFHLVKKIQKHLNKPSMVNADFDMEKYQKILKKEFEALPIVRRTTRSLGLGQIPLPFLVHFLRYFWDHKLKDYEVNFRIIFNHGYYRKAVSSAQILNVFVKSESKGVEVNGFLGYISEYCYLSGQRDYLSANFIKHHQSARN